MWKAGDEPGTVLGTWPVSLVSLHGIRRICMGGPARLGRPEKCPGTQHSSSQPQSRGCPAMTHCPPHPCFTILSPGLLQNCRLCQLWVCHLEGNQKLFHILLVQQDVRYRPDRPGSSGIVSRPEAWWGCCILKTGIWVRVAFR